MKTKQGEPACKDAIQTRIVHNGRDPAAQGGVVNPPVYHGSTIVFPSLAALDQSRVNHDNKDYVVYGRIGSESTFALENAVADLENGFGAVSVSSGLAAVSTAFLACAGAGDHVLVADTVYGPTRSFCLQALGRFGIEVEFYDPMVGGDIKRLFRPNTKLVFMESPGSITFEIQDAPAIAAVASARSITTVLDNSWATPLYFRPIEHGVNLSVIAATKYIVGHADAMMGFVVCDSEESYFRVRKFRNLLGHSLAPDDVYLGQRGLRTLAVRLQRHQENALALAGFLKSHPAVKRVIHPALADCPGHEIWKRDFTGSSGLFSIVLVPRPRESLAEMLDNLRHFAMGFSWGGYESLVVPQDPAAIRSATTWEETGQVLRIHAGLEDPDDLLTDLEEGLDRYLG